MSVPMYKYMAMKHKVMYIINMKDKASLQENEMKFLRLVGAYGNYLITSQYC